MTGAGVDLETFVPALIGVLYSRLNSTGMATFDSTVGIGLMDFRVLTMLASEPGITATRIVEAVGLNKGAVSRTLKSLKARGLVEAADNDGRNGRFQLATGGRTVHDHALGLTERRQEILLDGISPSDIRHLVRLLRTMIANSENLKTLGGAADQKTPRAEASAGGTGVARRASPGKVTKTTLHESHTE